MQCKLKKNKTSMTSYFMTCWTFLLLLFSFYDVVSLFLYIHSLFQHRCDYFQILNILLTKGTIHRLSVIPITSNVIGVRRTRRLKLKPWRQLKVKSNHRSKIESRGQNKQNFIINSVKKKSHEKLAS